MLAPDPLCRVNYGLSGEIYAVDLKIELVETQNRFFTSSIIRDERVAEYGEQMVLRELTSTLDVKK